MEEEKVVGIEMMVVTEVVMKVVVTMITRR